MASSLSHMYLVELQENSLFQKLYSFLKKYLTTEENDLLNLKLSKPMNY